jgi:hypothetical protein
MKNLLKVLVAIILAALTFTLASCDDSTPAETSGLDIDEWRRQFIDFEPIQRTPQTTSQTNATPAATSNNNTNNTSDATNINIIFEGHAHSGKIFVRWYDASFTQTYITIIGTNGSSNTFKTFEHTCWLNQSNNIYTVWENSIGERYKMETRPDGSWSSYPVANESIFSTNEWLNSTSSAASSNQRSICSGCNGSGVIIERPPPSYMGINPGSITSRRCGSCNGKGIR